MNTWQPIENIPLDTRVLLNLNGHVYIGECHSKNPAKYIFDHRPVNICVFPNNNGPAAWQNLPEVN